MAHKVLCPHCENVEMNHTVFKETHIYICEECPNVMFEYSTNTNVSELAEYLSNN